jgi:hypothetical protein
VSCSGALVGVVVENAHAEVRTRYAFDGRAGRSDDEAVEASEWSGRLEAIEGAGMVEEGGGVRLGRPGQALLLAEVKFASSKSCGTLSRLTAITLVPVAHLLPPSSISDTRPLPGHASVGPVWRVLGLPGH